MNFRLSDLVILIRGGGEMASGIAHRLHRCHMKIVITEAAMPTVVRRTIAFAEAVYEGATVVEGVRASKVSTVEQAYEAWAGDEIPIFVDPEAKIREPIKPSVVVDAIIAKTNIGTNRSFAPLVIGIGPGFTAGVDVHAVVESDRGHDLGRVIWDGQAARDTGIPASVAGFADERVLRTPKKGLFRALHEIGDLVRVNDLLAEVDGYPIRARVGGILRGILKDGISVEEGIKAGDIDPRGEKEYCYLISDKARSIAGGVLEAILHTWH